MAEPDGDETHRDGGEHVPTRFQPRAFFRQLNCLEAETGEGGLAAANANEEEEPSCRIEQGFTVGVFQVSE